MPKLTNNVIVQLQKKIRGLPISCKMVEPDNLHVCLSFIGNVDDKGLSDLSKKLVSVCSSYGTLDVDVGKIKLIPSTTYVRVIALEASGGLEKVSNDIKERIGGSVKPPHITLCRVKQVSDKNSFLSGIEELNSNIDPQTFTIDSISIIRSILSPKGPTYDSVKTFELRGS